MTTKQIPLIIPSLEPDDRLTQMLPELRQEGIENIVLVDACMTRLRVTVKDPAKVADLAAWKAEGALSLLVKGDGIQAVYGPKADVLKSDINDVL